MDRLKRLVMKRATACRLVLAIVSISCCAPPMSADSELGAENAPADMDRDRCPGVGARRGSVDGQSPAGRAGEQAGSTPAQPASSRRFRLDFGGTVRQLTAGARVRVWLPMPKSDAAQRIDSSTIDVSGRPTISIGAKYGNKILFFERTAPATGEISFNVRYEVLRSEVPAREGSVTLPLSDARRRLFLEANSKVPVDGKPIQLLAGLDLPPNDPLKVAERLYASVGDHMQYDKSRPGFGTGDANWACDSGFGNCTDFHSLFISLSRSQNIPARFEIGFPLPRDQKKGTIGGYHCWAYFFASGRGWTPVDISEGDKHPEMRQYYFGSLTADRIAFTTGRDLVLVPKQEGPPLNYFIYPYVEVNGDVWPTEKVERRFSFEDLE